MTSAKMSEKQDQKPSVRRPAAPACDDDDDLSTVERSRRKMQSMGFQQEMMTGAGGGGGRAYAPPLGVTRSGSRCTEGLLLLDVTPLTLGVAVGETTVPVIRRNTTIPTKKSITLLPDQISEKKKGGTDIQITLYEGERQSIANNNVLGSLFLCHLTVIEPIEVVFDIDANGILTVSATAPRNNVAEKLTITNDKGRLSKEDIERMLHDAAAHNESAANVTGPVVISGKNTQGGGSLYRCTAAHVESGFVETAEYMLFGVRAARYVLSSGFPTGTALVDFESSLTMWASIVAAKTRRITLTPLYASQLPPTSFLEALDRFVTEVHSSTPDDITERLGLPHNGIAITLALLGIPRDGENFAKAEIHAALQAEFLKMVSTVEWMRDPSSKDDRALSARLTRFYTFYHRTDKLGNIPSILREYRGRHAELWKSLKGIYGDEPPPPPDEERGVQVGVIQQRHDVVTMVLAGVDPLAHFVYWSQGFVAPPLSSPLEFRDTVRNYYDDDDTDVIRRKEKEEQQELEKKYYSTTRKPSQRRSKVVCASIDLVETSEDVTWDLERALTVWSLTPPTVEGGGTTTTEGETQEKKKRPLPSVATTYEPKVEEVD